MLPPRPLLASALLLVGGLGWSLASSPPPVSSLAEAGRWEGQSVTLEGWASDVRQDPEGVRLVLVDGADAVPVRVSSALAETIATGDRIQASGRLARWQGSLRLEVEDASGVQLVAGAAAVLPTLAEVAAAPADWQGRLLLVRGLVADGRLSDGPWSVALGDGPWPEAGPVRGRGLLRWDAACLCHRLDAREVWPWTP
jgi:hypothetical protein